LTKRQFVLLTHLWFNSNAIEQEHKNWITFGASF